MPLNTTETLKHVVTQDMVIADDETLRRIQRVLLLILDDIVGYCEEEGIVYSLGGGSVLGAVRHQGFIPWDDDIDINMPRADYNRFIHGFAARFPKKYTLQSPELTPAENGVPMCRVRLNGTTMLMHDDADGAAHGIYIDVTPVDDCFDQAVVRNLHGVSCMGVGLLYSCRRFFRDRHRYLALSEGDPSFRKTVLAKVAIGGLVSPIPLSAWSWLVVHTYSLCKNPSSRLVVVPAGRAHFFGEMYLRDGFLKTRSAAFEGRTVQIPYDAEAYLQHLYGNWQELPPESSRERHAYLQLDFGPYATMDSSDGSTEDQS